MAREAKFAATARDGAVVTVADVDGKGELTENGKVFLVASVQVAIWLGEARCFSRRISRGARVQDLINEAPAFDWADVRRGVRG